MCAVTRFSIQHLFSDTIGQICHQTKENNELKNTIANLFDFPFKNKTNKYKLYLHENDNLQKVSLNLAIALKIFYIQSCC